MKNIDEPWKQWIPGILNSDQINQLCNVGLIIGEGSLRKAIGESSIDLSLSDIAYKMTEGSVKPSNLKSYEWLIREKKLVEKLTKDNDGTFTLKSKETYIFKLRERLDRRLADGCIYGQATAKSSVGRVDVLARLIIDGMDTYESFYPDGLNKGNGDMFIEITPITFSVKVKEGICLSQLRFCYGEFEKIEVKSEQMFKTVLGSEAKDGSLTVNLENTNIGGIDVAAFCATTPDDPNDTIPLWKEENELKPDPCKYWKFIKGKNQRLKIEQNKFYILRSKEKISVPAGIALYCRASDETIGEMRIHYAGFVHPLFGLRRNDNKIGTPLIFEVRGHQVDVSLSDGEKLANLQFYRMSKDYSEKKSKCPYKIQKLELPRYCEEHNDCPTKITDKLESSYENQDLKLSAFFKDWPKKLKGKNDGSVEPR